MLHAAAFELALILLAAAGYAAAYYGLDRLPRWPRRAAIAVSLASLVLWLFYLAMYFGEYRPWLGWAIVLRSYWQSELIAFGMGAGAAALQLRLNRKIRPRGRVARHNGLILAVLLACPLYANPIVHAPKEPYWNNEWRDGVCIQSTGYTCGAAAAATALRLFGRDCAEQEAARAVFTSEYGSTPWHMIRFLRARGLRPKLQWIGHAPENPPTPCIALVRLGNPKGVSHVLMLLDSAADTFTLADPQAGRFQWTKQFTYENYWFEGYIIYFPGKPPPRT